MIDSHLHIWDLERFSYGWIKPKTALYRNVLIAEVESQLKANEIQQGILVEAHNSVAELDWLLEVAAQSSMIAGVVGWWDFETLSNELLSEYAQNPHFKGVRQTWFTPRADLETYIPKLSILGDLGLSCDILGYGAFTQLAEIAQQVPSVRFVINHFGGVDLSREAYAEWFQVVQQMENYPNIYMKISGFLTAGGEDGQRDLPHYVQATIDLLTPERLLFGSDYPVCARFGSTYQDVMSTLNRQLDTAQMQQIMKETAHTVYRIG